MQHAFASKQKSKPGAQSTERKAQRAGPRVQAKALVINKPGDAFEQEADRVAEQVMGMAAPVAPVGVAHEPVVQRGAAQQAGPGTAPPIVHDVLRTPGQPLDAATRDFVEPRFGRDFSGARVHNDSQAAHSAAALNARAYTLGNHIVFGAGEYAPKTMSGRSLITHELAHIVQQEGTSNTIQGKLKIGSPSDSAEQAADAAAHTVMAAETIPYNSAALGLRDILRNSSLPQPIIQRAVNTWGGEYDTDKYALTKDPGMDGVEIELRFKPNKNVDAELIGMTQTVRSSEKSGPFAIGAGKEKKALESRMIPTGEAGAGTMIDRIASYGNPLYPADKPSPGDTLSDTPTVAFWGQHGWYHTDKAGKLKKQDALLKDRPQLFSTRKESSQVFETTALAVKGVQQGTFYGSVQWGWEKDAAGKVKKLPLSLVSRGVPSATFGRASELWNKAKTSKGKATIDLPVVDVKVINQDDVKLYSNPIDALVELTPGTPLPRGTRLRVLDASDNLVHKIEVVDGPMTGQRGYIVALGSYGAER